MRIISGRLGGRRLPARVPLGVRPTSDRVREALFSMLEARNAVVGARVLDLFAGTGALGLEALSRGAETVVAVDREPAALAALGKNAAALGISSSIHGVRADVATLTQAALAKRAPFDGMFNLVLMDPPYASLDLAVRWLKRLPLEPWLARDALLALEIASRSRLDIPAQLLELQRRTYGDSAVVLFSAIA